MFRRIQNSAGYERSMLFYSMLRKIRMGNKSKLTILIALTAIGCGETKGPTEVSIPEPPGSATVSSVSNPTPTQTPSSTQEGRICEFGRDGYWKITNTTDIPQTYYQWSTDKDQSITQGPRSAIINPSQSWEGYGTEKCSQVDISHDGDPVTSKNVLCFQYYDANGKNHYSAGYVDWNACTVTPTPIPSPKPTPTPCPYGGKCR